MERWKCIFLVSIFMKIAVTSEKPNDNKEGHSWNQIRQDDSAIRMTAEAKQSEKVKDPATNFPNLERILNLLERQVEQQAQTNKLQAQGNKLQAETNKLQAETNKLQDETNKFLAQANELQAETNKLLAQANKSQAEANQQFKTSNRHEGMMLAYLNTTNQFLLNLSLDTLSNRNITKGILCQAKRAMDLHEALNPTVELSPQTNSCGMNVQQDTSSAAQLSQTLDTPRRVQKHVRSKIRKAMKIRPARGYFNRTGVYFCVRVIQIIELNEAEEYIKLKIHVRTSFDNKYLQFDNQRFGVDAIRMESTDELWIPDITPFNSIDINNENNYFPPKPIITNAGRVWIFYPRIYKFTCLFDNYYFPFDYQKCVLVFRSLSHFEPELEIREMNIDTSDQIEENDEWEIIKVTDFFGSMKSVTTAFSRYSVHEKHILLKRRPLYYIVNLLVPSLMISQVAFFGFFGPSSSDGERAEKINLGMGTLLAMSVLLLTASGMTTISSIHIPLIGIFFLINMLLISAGTIATSFIMTVHQRGKRKKRVPQYIQSILFFRLAPCMGFKIPSVIRNLRTAEFSKNEEFCGTESNKHCDEEILLDEIPSIKRLKEQIDSITNFRQREISEVEYIFLAKILDVILLVLFSLILYVSTGLIFYIGLSQIPPQLELKTAEYKNPYFYQNYPERYVNEIMTLFDSDRNEIIDMIETETARKRCKTMFCNLFLISYLTMADLNMDEAITKKELVLRLQMVEFFEVNATITSAFDAADFNLDNKLSKDEFPVFIDLTLRKHIETTNSDQLVEKIFSTWDENDDGNLLMLEICFGCNPVFK